MMNPIEILAGMGAINAERTAKLIDLIAGVVMQKLGADTVTLHPTEVQLFAATNIVDRTLDPDTGAWTIVVTPLTGAQIDARTDSAQR